MNKSKKKFLIIFFSALAGICFVYGLLMGIVFLIDYNKENEIKELLGKIQENGKFIYSSNQNCILYKSKQYSISQYIGDDSVSVEYIREDIIIYSVKNESSKYSYCSINERGESIFLFDADVNLKWNFYNDDIFFLNHINRFFTYKLGSKYYEEISQKDYVSNIDNIYRVYQVNNTYLNIINNSTGVTAQLGLNQLLPNDIISKFAKKDLYIGEYLTCYDDIYLVICLNDIYTLVIKYDFNDETIVVVDKIINGFWNSDSKIFFLENEVCYPLNSLIAKGISDFSYS